MSSPASPTPAAAAPAAAANHAPVKAAPSTVQRAPKNDGAAAASAAPRAAARSGDRSRKPEPKHGADASEQPARRDDGREKERARQESINRAHQAQIAAANGHAPASASASVARGGRGAPTAARTAAAPRTFSGDRKWADEDGSESKPHAAPLKSSHAGEEREQNRKPVNEQAFYKPGRAGRDVAAGADPAQQASTTAAPLHHNPPRGHHPVQQQQSAAPSASSASASSAHPSRPPIAHSGASHPAPAAASNAQPQQPTRPPVPFRASKPTASPAAAAAPVSSSPSVHAPRPSPSSAAAPASSPSPQPSPTASPPPPVGTKQYAAWERARLNGERMRAEAAAKQPGNAAAASSRGAGKNAPVPAAAASNEPHRISYAAMAAKQPTPSKERSDSEKRVDAAPSAAAAAPASSSAAPTPASRPSASPSAPASASASPSASREPLMSFNVETADSGLQLLSVYEGDDPRAVAARFCRTHKHESMQEAIAIIIMENIAAMGLTHKIKSSPPQQQ